MKLHVERDVLHASGTQTFTVEATTEAKAKKKFLAGDAEITENDVEVTSLADWDWDAMYSEKT